MLKFLYYCFDDKLPIKLAIYYISVNDFKLFDIDFELGLSDVKYTTCHVSSNICFEDIIYFFIPVFPSLSTFLSIM